VLNRPAPDRLNVQLMYVIRSGRSSPTSIDDSARNLASQPAPEVETPPAPVSAVEFAAYVVAVQEGAVQRIFQRHHPTPNGLCAGCLATPTAYPCQVARIAELAQQHPAYRRARDGRP
jgi:hypothetical protein